MADFESACQHCGIEPFTPSRKPICNGRVEQANAGRYESVLRRRSGRVDVDIMRYRPHQALRKLTSMHACNQNFDQNRLLAEILKCIEPAHSHQQLKSEPMPALQVLPAIRELLIW